MTPTKPETRDVERAISTIRSGTWGSQNELEEAVEALLSSHEHLTREVERLAFLHDNDHKLADTWLTRAENAERAVWLLAAAIREAKP